MAAMALRNIRHCATAVLLMWLTACDGNEPVASQSPTAGDPLIIYSSADTAVFADVLSDFHRLRPDIPVRYVELDSGDAYVRYLREARHGTRTADVILSSAMDLQLKLANDGEARTVALADAGYLPPWARWRNAAFGFTFEPAVMVFNRSAMAGRALPRSRAALTADLGRDPAFWRGRIGTYDIVRSRVGYLLATQDAHQNPRQQALTAALASVQAQSDVTSGTILKRIESGALVGGYNILASYAERRQQAGAPITIVYPADYTLVLSRTAIVTRASRHPAAATVLLAYLLSRRGQEQVAKVGSLNAIRTDMDSDAMRQGLSAGQVGRLRPIVLGPGLLVYLDARKRARFLTERHAVTAAFGDASLPTVSPPSVALRVP